MLTRLYSPARHRNREQGFTLIELLIVVIIIGILAAIALPIFLNQQKAAADARVQSDVRNTVDSVQTFLVANSGTAYANTGAYTTAGGKVTQSTNDSIGVYVNADGSYQVCAYSANGAQYTSASSAFTYTTSGTGAGTFATAACASGSDTGGTASNGSAAPATVNLDVTTMTGWTSTGSLANGTDANGNYIGAVISSNGNIFYNYDNSRSLFTAGHKYTVTFKSASGSANYMNGYAGGNSTGFYGGTAGAVASRSMTFTYTSGTTNQIYVTGGAGYLRIYSISIQDVT